MIIEDGGLSDTVLNDDSGFADSTPAPAPAEPAKEPAKEPLELTEDQALDDSAAQTAEGDEGGDKTENPVEKRIKGALAARDDARNKLANAQEENKALAARIAAIEAKFTPEKAAEAAEEVPPNPEDYEFGALDQKYIDDAIDYRTKVGVREALGSVEQRFQQQREQQAVQAEQQAAIDDAKTIVAKGAAKFDDFEEVVWERGLREEYKLDKPTFDALRDPETVHADEIIYALASDPAEAARVAAMSPTQQTRYVLAKDAEIAGKATTRTTKAPPPPGQQVRGQSGRFTTPGDTESLEDFEKEFYKKK